MTPVPTPTLLSDAHLDRLQELLEASGSGNAMNMERLDGFLSALITGPDLVMPSEYLPLVWGGGSADESSFASGHELE